MIVKCSLQICACQSRENRISVIGSLLWLWKLHLKIRHPMEPSGRRVQPCDASLVHSTWPKGRLPASSHGSSKPLLSLFVPSCSCPSFPCLHLQHHFFSLFFSLWLHWDKPAYYSTLCPQLGHWGLWFLGCTAFASLGVLVPGQLFLCL